MKEREEKGAFWSSWTGVAFVGFVVLCLAIVFGSSNDGVNEMPVWIEVRQRLTETKCVEQYFAAQEKIEPLANTKYARNEWVIERFNGGLKGYFSVAVTGWKKLDDNRISYEAFIIHFRKLLTCICGLLYITWRYFNV